MIKIINDNSIYCVNLLFSNVSCVFLQHNVEMGFY